MTIKIKADRAGPPGDKVWRRLNEGLSIEVAGIRHRREAVAEFIQGASRSTAGGFGVVARREPENPHSKGGRAVAVDGWWNTTGWLRSREARRHIGYLPEWASQECLEGKCPEPAVYVELYSCYLGHDGFVDVDIIVHVEKSADELEFVAKQKVARELRKRSLPGLKVLAHMATMSNRPSGDAEMGIMRRYVESLAERLAIGARADDIDDIVEAACGMAPSDQAVMAGIRAIAHDDAALDAVFAAGLAMGRADGTESKEEADFLRRVLATAGRRRSKLDL